jgi:hypothetical protein
MGVIKKQYKIKNKNFKKLIVYLKKLKKWVH